MTAPDKARDPERGIVLVNVLVVLAIASGVVVLMLGAQERALARTAQALDVTRAEALAQAGETSAVVALRRDMEEAPGIDHLAEPWASVAQEPIALEDGRFSLTLRDVNARFDLNRLAARRIVDLEAFRRLAAATGLAEDSAQAVIAALVRGGPVADLAQVPGLEPADRALLAPHVVTLPPEREGRVNLNTAGPTVLAALLGAAGANRLLGPRAARGFIDAAALEEAGVAVPPGAGLTSDLWEVEITADAGAASVRRVSRLLRWRDAEGGTGVAVIARRPPETGDTSPPPVGLD